MPRAANPRGNASASDKCVSRSADQVQLFVSDPRIESMAGRLDGYVPGLPMAVCTR